MLNQIIFEHAKATAAYANYIGEILRAWAFVGEYGCYSSFDVRPEFIKIEATEREFSFLWGRQFDRDDIDENYWGYSDVKAIKEISWYKHPSGIEMGWYWDGDGMLAFYIPELINKYCNGVIRNNDCKKDNEWELKDIT